MYIIGICFAISALLYGLPIAARLYFASPDTQFPATQRFARRLPPEFSGQILRLSGDGHYVNVSTTQGVYDVRIRLSDAVDEMDCVDGFWVHRSHWVVKDAVKTQSKERGRPVLVLTNGDAVPVSAKYQRQLEDAGIL